MNCSSCFLEPNYIYAFGGIGASDYLSSIERFNTNLKIWTPLQVQLPQKISNTFAIPINLEEILVLGGLKHNSSEASKKKFEIENKLLSFNTRKESFRDLKPLPFKKKLSHVVNNCEGKLFCYVIEKNFQLPNVFTYNLNKTYPYYDRFAYAREKEIRETLSH
jgi:hypothetical protein